VKLLKVEGDRFVFQLSGRSEVMLRELLALYPLVPTAHYRATRQADAAELTETEQLMREALAEVQQEGREKLQALLRDPAHWRETPHGFCLVVSAAEIDWLLQVLNDVRVGSWIKLGEPGYRELGKLDLNAQTARHFWAMELSGHFQALLLDALQRRQ
jgi:soluble cytochrome b562